MVPFVLNSELNASLSTDYTSVSVTVAGLGGSVIATVDAGEILRNGVPLGQSVSVVDDDVVQVRLTSAATDVTSVYATLIIDDQSATFRITTDYGVPTQVYNPDYVEEHPLGIDVQDSGLPYYPVPPEAVYKLDVSDVLTRVQFGDETEAPLDLDATYVWIADFFNDRIHQINIGTLETVNVIETGRRPYMLAYEIVPGETPELFIWVTLFGENRVVKLDTDFQEVASHTIPGPIGIDVDHASGNVFIGSYLSDTLYRIDSGGGINSIAVGSKPYSVRFDSNSGNVYVANSGDDTVSYVDGTSFVSVTDIVVGEAPWSIDISDSGTVWVTVSAAGELVKITNNTVAGQYPVGVVPLAVAVRGSHIYVSDYQSPHVYRVSDTGAILNTVTLTGGGRAISIDEDADGNLWMPDYYPSLPSRYEDSDMEPTGFAITDELSASLDSLVLSEAITIEDINVATPATLDTSLYEAAIIKNDVDVGTSTTVENGDVIRLQLRSADTVDVVRRSYLTIGNFEAEWIVKTLSLDVRPDPIFFEPVYNAIATNVYTSNTETISGLEGASVQVTFDGDGEVYKNGAPVTVWPETAVDGDTFYILTTAGALPCQRVAGTLNVGLASAAYTVITEGLAVDFTSDAAYDETPYSIAFGQDSSNNVLYIINPGAAPETLAITDTTGGTFPTTGQIVVSAAFFDNKIHIVERDSRTILDTFQTVSQPFSIGVVMDTAENHYMAVSSHDTGTVRIFKNLDESDFQDVGVGDGAAGIATNGTDTIGVASHTNGTVAILTLSNGTFTLSRTVTASGNPMLMCHQPGTNYFWVANHLMNQIHRIDYLTGAITTYTVGRRPWGITATATHVYVAHSADNTIWKIDATTGEYVDGVVTGSVPFYLDYNHTTSSLWVSHLQTTSVLEYDDNLDLIGHMLAPNPSYGLDVDETGDIWVQSFWPGTPSRTVDRDLDIDSFTGLAAPILVEDIPLATESTASVDISGEITRPTMVHVNGVYGSYIVVNGVVQGTSALVNNWDTIEVRATVTSAPYYDHYVSISGCSTFRQIIFRTEPDTTPAFFTLDPVFDQHVGLISESNTVTITGMTPGSSSLMTVDHGTIVLNGVDSGSSSVDVFQGDTISIRAEALGPYGNKTVATVTAGLLVVPWEIHSLQLGDAYESWLSNSRRLNSMVYALNNMTIGLQFSNLYSGALRRTHNALQEFEMPERLVAESHSAKIMAEFVKDYTPVYVDNMVFAGSGSMPTPVELEAQSRYTVQQLEYFALHKHTWTVDQLGYFALHANIREYEQLGYFALHANIREYEQLGYFALHANIREFEQLGFFALHAAQLPGWEPMFDRSIYGGHVIEQQLEFMDVRRFTHERDQWPWIDWRLIDHERDQWQFFDWRLITHERDQWQFFDWRLITHERDQWPFFDWRLTIKERDQWMFYDWRLSVQERDQWPFIDMYVQTDKLVQASYDHKALYLAYNRIAPTFNALQPTRKQTAGHTPIVIKYYMTQAVSAAFATTPRLSLHPIVAPIFTLMSKPVTVDVPTHWVKDELVLQGCGNGEPCRYYPYQTEQEAYNACIAAGYDAGECGTFQTADNCWVWHHIVPPLTKCDAMEWPEFTGWYIQGG